MNQETDIHQALSKSLEHISRQRVRYIQMELRKHATDSRIKNERKFWNLLETSGLRLPQRTAANFMSAIRDQRGINIDRAVKYLKESQKRTRRDSVEALIAGEIKEAHRKRGLKSAKGRQIRGDIEDDKYRGLSKRMSMDEFRRVGRLVVNASSLTSKMRENISSDNKVTTDPVEGNQQMTNHIQNGNLLEMLLENNKNISDGEESVCEPKSDLHEVPEHHERKMDLLTVPSVSSPPLPESDPTEVYQSPDINRSKKKKKKSKKPKMKSTEHRTLCPPTIVVEDTSELNEITKKVEDNQKDDGECVEAVPMIESLNDDKTGASEQIPTNAASSVELDQSDENFAPTITAEIQGTPQEQQRESLDDSEGIENSEIIANDIGKGEQEEHTEDDVVFPITTSEEELCPDERPALEHQTSELTDTNETDNILNKNTEETLNNHDEIQTNANKSNSLDETSPLSSEEAGESIIRNEEDQEKSTDPKDVKSLDGAANRNGANDKIIESETSPGMKENESDRNGDEESVPEYSTDSFTTDDTNDLTISESQSSFSEDGMERPETSFDTRSIAEFGGEIVSVGGFEVTTYPPEWYNNRAITEAVTSIGISKPPHLQVEWVYGCDTSHAQSMVAYGDDEVVYGTGCIVVLYNHSRATQRHYLGHSGPITCIAVHPTQNTVGSAQGESKPAMDMEQNVSESLRTSANHDSYHGRIHIRVWDAVDLSTLFVLGVGTFQNNVRKMQFMKFQNFMLTIEDDRQSSLTLWESGCKLKRIATVIDTDEEIDIKQPENKRTLKQSVNNQRKNKRLSDNSARAVAATATYSAEFAIAGKEHLGFWKIKDLECLSSESMKEEFVKISGPLKGDFLKQFRPRFVTCCVSLERNGVACYVTGDTNGTIMIWSEERKEVITSVNHAHECPISCIVVTKAHLFSSGSTDRSVRAYCWNKNEMERVGRITLPKNVGQITSLSCVGSNIFVATSLNIIVTAPLHHPAYSCGFVSSSTATKMSDKTRMGNEAKELISDVEKVPEKNIFGRWEPKEVARGAKDTIRCVCVSGYIKKKQKSRQSTPLPVTKNERVLPKSARIRSNKINSMPIRPLRSARPYKGSPIQNIHNYEEKSCTPDGPQPATIAFSSPKLRTADRVLEREKSKNSGIDYLSYLLFAQENYVDKSIFETTGFPQGSASQSSISEIKAPDIFDRSECLWIVSNDGWIIVYNQSNHSIMGRMKLASSFDITCMDCSANRALIAFGCKRGLVVLIRILSDGFELTCETKFQSKGVGSVQLVRFSDNGKKLACSCGDEIIVSSVRDDGLHEMKRYDFHQESKISSIEWSSVRLRGADLLRVCLLGSEPKVIVWSMEESEAIEDLSTLRNISWSILKNPLDFAVKGIWDHIISVGDFSSLAITHPYCKNSTDTEKEQNFCDDTVGSYQLYIEPFDNTRLSSSSRGPLPKKGSVCCVGDRSGCVRAYHFPCIVACPSETVFRVFHSAVSDVVTSGTSLFAASDHDRTVIQFDASQDKREDC